MRCAGGALASLIGGYDEEQQQPDVPFCMLTIPLALADRRADRQQP